MNKTVLMKKWLRSGIGAALGYGVLLQAGCLGNVTTTTTITGRDFILTILRNFIVAPLDAILVQAVDNTFDED